jgi:hypothetical protein
LRRGAGARTGADVEDSRALRATAGHRELVIRRARPRNARAPARTNERASREAQPAVGRGTPRTVAFATFREQVFLLR